MIYEQICTIGKALFVSSRFFGQIWLFLAVFDKKKANFGSQFVSFDIF
jgi:hypothetical protein